MSEIRTLNVIKELKGMPVLTARGEDLGQVWDVIVHPTEGNVYGIIIRTPEGRDCGLAARDFFIGASAVMAVKPAYLNEQGLTELMPDGVYALRDLAGTKVITEDGQLIGQVSDVYIAADWPQAFYRVTDSVWQRFLGGGFFIAGDVPHAYSPDGLRMIVPADTRNRYAATSLLEIVDSNQQQSAAR